MLDELNNLKDLNFNEKLAKLAIKPVIWTKHKLGLGQTLKKTNTGSERTS